MEKTSKRKNNQDIKSSQREQEITFHKYQMEAWEAAERFLLVLSGTQGGKTFFGEIWIQNMAEQDLSADYLVAAPTYKMLEQSTLKKFHEMNVLPGRWNEQKKEWQTSHGGRIFFRSAEDPDSLEAMTLKAAWLDEAGRMKAKVFPIMQSRLGFNKGRLLLTTTPYAMNWLYWDIYKQAKAGVPDFKVVEFSSLDNPWYPEDEFERARGTCGSDLEFKRRFLGQFVRMQGLVYPDFSRSMHVIKRFDIPSGWFKFGGMDFGFTESHPTVCIFMAVDEKANVYIYKRYRKTKGLMNEHADSVKGVLRGYKDRVTIWGDSSAQQEIAELRHLFSTSDKISIVSKKTDANLGRDRVGRYLRQNKLFIFDDLKDIIDEFETYSWKEKEGLNVVRDEVVKDKDDAMDAIRYGIMNAIFYPPEAEKIPLPAPKPRLTFDTTTGYPKGVTYNDEGSLRRRLGIFPLLSQVRH